MFDYGKLWKKLKDENIPVSYLTEAAKVSPGTVIRLRNNMSVSVYSLEKICRALDCDIDEIMEYVGD